jgi:hypothetical protein
MKEAELVHEETSGWRLDRRISLDVIIAALSLLGLACGYAISQARWQGTTETRIQNLEATDTRIIGDSKTQKEELTKRLDHMDEKLDRLLTVSASRR